MSIEVRNISKRFGAYQALENVSLKINDGELVALVGPSGSGKTTLLRIIAGLEAPDPHPGSAIFLHSEEVAGRHVRERQVGFVFQHYALFRNMTVFENVAFGLRVRPRRYRPARADINRRVTRLLELVHLQTLARRYPAQLSGGQRQRVALARALAVEPRVLLLDEPFGALDAKVRQELRGWLRQLHQELHITSVLVTHDQEEALETADRVVVMNHAKIEQVGTPEEIFHRPATPFVMEFLGQVNTFHGRVLNGKACLGGLEVDCPDHLPSEPRDVAAYVRPHELEITRHPTSGTNFTGRITSIHAAGPIARIQVAAKDFHVLIKVDVSVQRCKELELKTGDIIYLSPRNIRVFVPLDYSI